LRFDQRRVVTWHGGRRSLSGPRCGWSQFVSESAFCCRNLRRSEEIVPYSVVLTNHDVGRTNVLSQKEILCATASSKPPDCPRSRKDWTLARETDRLRRQRGTLGLCVLRSFAVPNTSCRPVAHERPQ
jgi:hypothetical protein